MLGAACWEVAVLRKTGEGGGFGEQGNPEISDKCHRTGTESLGVLASGSERRPAWDVAGRIEEQRWHGVMPQKLHCGTE